MRRPLALASLFLLSSGCATIVGADFDGKVLCTDDCPGAPTTVATTQDVTSIVVDTTNIYWLDVDEDAVGSVLSCPLTGCNDNPTVLATEQANPQGIAVDSTSVYWTNNGIPDSPNAAGSVMRCAVAGCDNAPTTLATGLSSPLGIATDGSSVYWANQGTGRQDGAILTCAVSGCASPTVLASGQNNPSGVAIDPDNIYWTNRGTDTGSLDGQVMRCAIGGCQDAPTMLASAQESPAALVVDASYVYWANATKVSRCAIAGCADIPDAIATGVAPVGIAVDHGNVYFSDTSFRTGSAGIRSCALEGCGDAPTSIVSLVDTVPGPLAISATTVYWGAEGNSEAGEIDAYAK